MGIILFILVGQNVVSIYYWKQHESIIKLVFFIFLFFFPVYLCPVYGDSSAQESLSLCPEDRRFCVFSLVFSSDGREILGGANDGYLYVYDRECHQRAFRVYIQIFFWYLIFHYLLPTYFFFFL